MSSAARQTQEVNLRSVFLQLLLQFALLEQSSGLLLGQEPQRDIFSELDRLDHDTLVRAVVERNPTIEAARQAWLCATEREPQVASLDDPNVSYSVAPLSIGVDDTRYGQSVVFTQRLPYPGKLHLRGEVARAEAEAARHDYEAVTLELATMASLLFDDDYFIARAIEINTEHLRLLEDFQRVATARYASGLAAQQDPIQAEVEVAQLLHRDVVLRTNQRTIAARLNALLHRPPEESLPPPPAKLGVPAPQELDPSSQADEALAERPELQARLAEIEAREQTIHLREKELYPDFEAMTSFNSMWGNSEHRWTVGVGIHLPVGRDRLRAASAEAAAALKQAQSERAALEDAIRTEVYVARERLVEAAQVVELYRSRLLPASGDQIHAARAGFETGQNSFLALIEAERNQRTVALDYEQALAEYHSSLARLDRALGRIPGMGRPGQKAAADPGSSNPEGGYR
jgi:outer membrane protein, heavy metal efflux system